MALLKRKNIRENMKYKALGHKNFTDYNRVHSKQQEEIRRQKKAKSLIIMKIIDL